MVTIAVGSVWPFGAAILTAAGPDVVREAGPDQKAIDVALIDIAASGRK